MTNEVRFLIDSLVEQLVVMVVEEYKVSVPQALELLYNSQLYEKITDLVKVQDIIIRCCAMK